MEIFLKVEFQIWKKFRKYDKLILNMESDGDGRVLDNP